MPTTHQPFPRRLAALAVPAVLLALTLGGCASDSADGRFQAGTVTEPLTCLAHQADQPGPAYTAAEGADTAAIFTMLRYFTTNKSVAAYCDGEAPTETDRSWAQLYVDLGADAANVSHILGDQAP
jgi:hypothetical protein